MFAWYDVYSCIAFNASIEILNAWLFHKKEKPRSEVNMVPIHWVYTWLRDNYDSDDDDRVDDSNESKGYLKKDTKERLQEIQEELAFDMQVKFMMNMFSYALEDNDGANIGSEEASMGVVET